MHVFGPPELKEILDIQFKYSQTELRYPLEFYATQTEKNELIYENPDVRIETFPLEHRIPCTGFRFNQKKRLPRILKEKVEELNIPIEMFPLIKRGIDFTDVYGNIHPASELTQEAEPPRSYAYCSDTICNWKYIEQIQGVSTLYHEATFMHDMADRAAETFHTTSLEAAQIAKKAGAQQLLLGHFSARYRELEPLQDEARTVFANAKLALEGHTFAV